MTAYQQSSDSCAPHLLTPFTPYSWHKKPTLCSKHLLYTIYFKLYAFATTLQKQNNYHNNLREPIRFVVQCSKIMRNPSLYCEIQFHKL